MSDQETWITLVLQSTDPKTLKCPLASRLYADLTSGLKVLGSTPQDANIAIVVPHPKHVIDLDPVVLIQALDQLRLSQPDTHVLVWMKSIWNFPLEGLRGLATCRDASVQAGGGMQLMELQPRFHTIMIDHHFRIIRGVIDALESIPDNAKGVLQTV